MSSRKITVYFQKSTNVNKKYKVTIFKPNGTKCTVHFGAKGYSDYTKHKDSERKDRYIARHKSREKWTKSGLCTAGFWSRWILWNKPSINGSIKATSSKFGIAIKKSKPPSKKSK